MYHDNVLRAGCWFVIRVDGSVPLVVKLDRYVPTEGILNSNFQGSLSSFLYVNGEIRRLVTDHTRRLNAGSMNFHLKTIISVSHISASRSQSVDAV